MEKTKEGSSNNSGNPGFSEHRVTIAGKTRNVKMASDKKRVNDLITELRNKYGEELKNFSFNQTVTAVLDGKVVKMNPDGKIEGNPLLHESSTLTLMPNVAGGI